MSTIRNRTISIIVMVCMLFSLITPFIQIEASAAASKAALNKKSVTLYVGQYTNLKVTGTNKTVKWSSSKKSVAAVNSKGKVTAKKAGKATITAAVGGKKYTCKVTVKKPGISHVKLTVKYGKTATLKLYGTKIKSVSSSNSKIVSVKKSGKITAKKVGKATVTLKGTNGKKYKCVVTVNAYLNKTKLTLVKGQSYKLKLNGIKIKSAKSSKPKVATVTKTGQIKAKGTGSCTITITGKNNKKYTCKLKVENPSLTKTKLTLNVGKTYQLKVKGNTQKVTWSSSNKKVATVSKGKITAKSAGTVNIIAKVASGKTYICKVTVKKPASAVTKYTVTFDSNGGTAVKTQTVAKNGVAAVPADPTKSGYIFAGWYIDEELTMEYSFDQNVTRNICLYAKWTAIEDETYYTRAEWIGKLAEYLDMNLDVNAEDVDYYYCDTKNTEHGIAIETAYAYGILPAADLEDLEQDVASFYPNEKATREFVAYTAVKAMGFETGYSIDVSSWKDWNSITYKNEAAIAVQEGFLALQNGFFNPSKAATGKDISLVEVAITKIQESEIVNYTEEKCEIEYAEDVVTSSTAEIENYTVESLGNERYRVTVFNYDDNGKIKIDSVVNLPANDTYIAGLALKVDAIETRSNNKLVFTGVVPKVEEVYEKIDFAGEAVAVVDAVEASDGVTAEYVPPMSRIGGTTSLPGTLKFNIREKDITDDMTASGYVEVEIPAVTLILDADFGVFRGIDVDEFTFSVQEEIKIVGEIECTLAESGYELTNSLGNTRFEKGRIELGRVPFAIGTTGLSVDLVFFYNVSAKGSASITYTIDTKQGYQYKNGTSRGIFKYNDSLDFIELKGSASAGVGFAADICAFAMMDLIGYSAEGGVAFNASFTPHILATNTLYCGDVTLYAYLKHGLDQETVVGKFLADVVGYTLEFEPLKNDADNPFKLKFHVENASRVSECTFGRGSISGTVQRLETDAVMPNAKIQIYQNDRIVRTDHTDSNGKYKIDNLTDGRYKVVISATGFMKYSVTVDVTSGATTYVEAALMIDRNYANSSGTVMGTITNAVNGEPVSGTSYKLYKGWNTSTGELIKSGSFDDSSYSLTLVSGNYTLLVSKDGYVENSVNISVSPDLCTAGNVILSPTNGFDEDSALRVVLSWGEYPQDLDSHLFGPMSNDSTDKFHVYYYDQDQYDEDWENLICNLDIDDRDGYGPETTTVYKDFTGCDYSFYIHDYTNRDSDYSDSMSKSKAKVQVYIDNMLRYTFSIPQDKEGTVWHVFDYDAANDELKPVNEFYYAYDPEYLAPYSLNDNTEDAIENDIDEIIKSMHEKQ